MTPEQRAPPQIDSLLQQCGWIVQDRSQTNLAARPGVAIRESAMKSGELLGLRLAFAARLILWVFDKITSFGAHRNVKIQRMSQEAAGRQESEELSIDEVMDENEAAVAYDIASYPSDLTLSVIAEMWKNGDIEIPEFQRHFVWSIKQSSLLIESFLLGLPVPQVFFYIDDRHKSLVIDGQQRILSVVSYLDGYFGMESIHGKRQVFRLEGLNEKSPFANKRFVDLDEISQRKLKSAILRAINIRQLSPSGEHTSVYHIFERLNTGGTPLKPQEIRHCVFRGDFSSILKELNKDENWRLILGKKTLDRYQKDVELVLRLFALNGALNEYEKPMKDFLNRTMEKERSGKSQRVQRFKQNFPKAAKLILEKLGSAPFNVRGPLNTSVLDSVFCTILDNLVRIPQNLPERYKLLINNRDFLQYTYTHTSDVTVVTERFRMAHKYLIDK